MHLTKRCTTDLMLTQGRVFPTGGKYRSLLGEFFEPHKQVSAKNPQ